MAHVVGVPKRDPCSACGLPVFLAERLTIPNPNDGGSKRVYHRTCLRCARCKSQLTPGSFYETEVDGEYCCETCPDEEKLDALKNPTLSTVEEKFTGAAGPSRGSIADRLAFFENDGKKLLQKSLSDEEKSQSLQKISETQKSVYKQNSALSKFMTNTLTDTPDSGNASPDRTESNQSSRRSSTSTSSAANEMDDETNEPTEKIPDLPKSLPPSISPIADVVKRDSSPSPASTSFKSSLQLSLDYSAESPKLDRSPSKVSTISSNTSSTKQIASDKFEGSENEEQNKSDKSREEASNITPTKSIGEPLSSTPIANPHLTDQTNVTKDISDTDEKMRTTTTSAVAEDTSIPSTTITTTSSNASPTNFDDISQTNRSSMVRARLHQFEIISSNSPSSSISSNISKSSTNDRSSISPRKDSASIQVDTEEVSERAQPATVAAETDESLETEVPKIVTETTTIVAESNIKENYSSKSSLTNLELNEPEIEINASCPDTVTDTDSPVLPDKFDEKYEQESQQVDKEPSSEKPDVSLTEEYPEDLNPFQSDDDEGDAESVRAEKKEDMKSEKEKADEKRKSLNPFDSSDDEIEFKDETPKKLKPPRPPPPKLKSTNPFDSEDDDDGEESKKSIESTKRRPVPTPRSHLASSQNSTPEPTPRLSRQTYATPLSDATEQYGSCSSLANQPASLTSSSEFLRRGSLTRGSTNSVVSSTGSLSGGKYKKTKKAPLPPKHENATVKELFPTPSPEMQKVSPQPRKKRVAPAPPPVAESSPVPTRPDKLLLHETPSPAAELPKTDDSKIGEEKLSDDEKLKEVVTTPSEILPADIDIKSSMRRISIDARLIDDSFVRQSDSSKGEETVVYRRTIAPLIMENSLDEDDEIPRPHDRQLEKLKDNKEAKNRNRQSQISLPTEENDPLFNKSIHGKWKRRKGPAPALPVPPKKVLQMVPLQEIRHELEIIEVQQQGLEKQGVMLEKMIRERCEGVETGVAASGGEGTTKDDEPAKSGVTNSKEVEDLIMQLFELVNEKNELFRRQAELMYLRRQHRLEQEQADLEYEIRVLMAQPERNKTDSDKAREEALIGRLVEVVQLRNEVIECLEMDRLREAEEDMSIKQRLEMHAAKRDEELCQQTPTKLSKKEKKRLKEAKKLGKSKKLDADKDADESELATTAVEKKEKKKKKNLLTSVIAFNK